MSLPYSPTNVFFFYSVIFSKREPNLLAHVLRSLSLDEKNFYSPRNHQLFAYYSKEMGEKEDLDRRVYFSHKQCERNELVKMKLKTNAIENNFGGPKNRLVNIDPGYLALEQVVLATCKPYSHRLYLAQGVYAELVYQFLQKRFIPLPWTYPDYQDSEFIDYFQNERKNLLKLNS